jgi:hypothetical protein
MGHKKRTLQFFGGPKDGESAETQTATTARWQHPKSEAIHLYLRCANGDYEYLGLKDDVIGGDGA